MQKLIAGFVLLWLILGLLPSDGAEKKLSLQAQELKRSLEVLNANPKDKSAQLQYLQKFPKDIKTFRNLFDRPDFSELYQDVDSYFLALQGLTDNYPEIAGKILVGVSKNASAGPDALSELRQATAKFAIRHTATFAKVVHGYSEKEISGLIWYLADVENHYYYQEYPQIIENLKKIGEIKLARQFEAAKKKRMKMPAHGKMQDEPGPYSGV